jgi:ubiquinone/menaquinone biosynthesis C-methylase UbiE
MSEKNIEYYDRIAGEYNDIQMNAPYHRSIREQVADVFKSKVKKGKVLDFGGGTGMDIEWLCQAGYKVFFYEPSAEMRKKAIEVIENPGLVSLITIVDSPADKKLGNEINAILANFAVMNSIQDIEPVFESFSKILDKEGKIFLLVIDTRIKKILFSKKHFIKVFLKIFLRRDITSTISHNEAEHCVCLHFLNDYKKKSKHWFRIEKITPLGGYGFLLLQLCRK